MSCDSAPSAADSDADVGFPIGMPLRQTKDKRGFSCDNKPLAYVVLVPVHIDDLPGHGRLKGTLPAID